MKEKKDEVNLENIKLPNAPLPKGHYVSVQKAGNLLFFSGAGPLIDIEPEFKGRLGEEINLEQGYQAARLAGLVLLSSLERELESNWSKLEQIIKVNGFIASGKDFNRHPEVLDGASDLFVEVLGKRGAHARSAVGVSSLPFNIPVEVEMIVSIK